MSTVAPAPARILDLGAQPMLIRRAAVLGAGTMGSRIAALLANTGIPVLLLDMPSAKTAERPSGDGPRNHLALAALEALTKSKPAALFDPAFAARIAPGNFDDDLSQLAQCDWVIEAVAENLAIKHALLERVTPHLGHHALLTTNTSGLPISQIASALPEAVRRRFFGGHFFNPPRYMRLLELIPIRETDPALLSSFAAFADRFLGKQIVLANDTPNFIANRIGVTVMFTAAALMLQQGLTIEEADALTGPAIGWPRTGTFRLADMVGIDVLAHVAANFPAGAGQNVAAHDVASSGKGRSETGFVAGHDFSRADTAANKEGALAPEANFSSILQEIVRRNWLGDKTNQGFYKKVRAADGKEERLVLDLKTLEYRPLAKHNIPSLEMAKNAATLPERLRLLLSADPRKDRPPLSCGRCSPRSGTSPPLSSAKPPTTRPPSTAPCAPASTGSSVPLKCGMPLASKTPSPA